MAKETGKMYFFHFYFLLNLNGMKDYTDSGPASSLVASVLVSSRAALSETA